MNKIYNLSLLVLLISFIGCADDPVMPNNVIGAKAPDVNTIEVLDETSTTVYVSGSLVKENGAPILEKGFVWYETNNPQVSRDSMRLTGEAFSITIEGLKEATEYTIQAYARNSANVGYGQALSFQTTPPIFRVVTTFEGALRVKETASYIVMGYKGYLFGGNTGGQSLTDEVWEFDGTSWNKKRSFSVGRNPQTPVYRSKMTAVTTGAAVVLYGGIDENQNVTSDLYAYLNDDSWSKLDQNGKEKPEALYNAVGCYNKELFFIGGIKSDKKTITDEIWAYLPFSYSWEKRPSFKEAQFGGIALSVGDTIYAGLGRNSPIVESSTNHLWASSDEAMTWRQLKTKPGGTVIAGVALGKSIYVIDNTNYIWRYDIGKDEWYQKSQLPPKSRNEIHCMYAINDLIYIGFGNGTQKELISYNPKMDE